MGRATLLLMSAICLFLAAEHSIAGQPNWHKGYLKDVSWEREPGEPALRYASRASYAVNNQSWHCPASLTGLSLIEKALFATGPKGLTTHGLLVRERFHCGVCSQRSYMLKGILAEQGIKSSLYFIGHHVVLRSGDIILDPDFGVHPFRIGDHERAYRGVKTEWPEFVSYAYSNPAPEQAQLEWNRNVEAEEKAQRAYFRIANWLTVALTLLGIAGPTMLVLVRR